MILTQPNHVGATLAKNGTDENLAGLSVDEIWKIVNLGGGVERPPSSRSVVGPAVDWLRKCLWRLLGIKSTQLAIPMRYLLASNFAFRKGTIDKDIFYGVIFNDEYCLPSFFAPDDIVLDIGMHIGSFCFAALLRGCSNVHGFEPEEGNFRLAARNLQGFGDRVHLYQKAVWRSDRTGDALFHPGYPEGNTGGGCILYNDAGQRLETIPFDDVVRNATNNGQRRIRLMKIDCEGSEFPILLTSRMLHLIDNIHGEYHNGVNSPLARVEGVAQLTIVELTRHLEAAGFVVKSFPTYQDQLGTFFASHPGKALGKR